MKPTYYCASECDVYAFHNKEKADLFAREKKGAQRITSKQRYAKETAQGYQIRSDVYGMYYVAPIKSPPKGGPKIAHKTQEKARF